MLRSWSEDTPMHISQKSDTFLLIYTTVTRRDSYILPQHTVQTYVELHMITRHWQITRHKATLSFTKWLIILETRARASYLFLVFVCAPPGQPSERPLMYKTLSSQDNNLSYYQLISQQITIRINSTLHTHTHILVFIVNIFYRLIIALSP